jgi:hypothetical protein
MFEGPYLITSKREVHRINEIKEQSVGSCNNLLLGFENINIVEGNKIKNMYLGMRMIK